MPRRLKKTLQRLRPWIWPSILLAIILALPVSYLGDHGFGIALEKTPAFGWIVSNEGMTDFEGYGCGIDHGIFFAYSFKPAMNPKPPLTGPYNTMYGADFSHWFGLRHYPLGLGTYLAGNMFHRDWTARTGVLFPLWPVSMLALIMFVRALYRSIRSRKHSESNLCPTCNYDLRAHAPNANCPECGTPMSPPKNSSSKPSTSGKNT